MIQNVEPSGLKSSIIEVPQDAPPQPEPTAEQGTYKIVGSDGREYEFPGLAVGPDGKITVASLIDLLLVIAASLDHPVVERILQANDLVLRDAQGKLWFPRARRAPATGG